MKQTRDFLSSSKDAEPGASIDAVNNDNLFKEMFSPTRLPRRRVKERQVKFANFPEVNPDKRGRQERVRTRADEEEKETKTEQAQRRQAPRQGRQEGLQASPSSPPPSSPSQTADLQLSIPLAGATHPLPFSSPVSLVDSNRPFGGTPFPTFPPIQPRQPKTHRQPTPPAPHPSPSPSPSPTPGQHSPFPLPPMPTFAPTPQLTTAPLHTKDHFDPHDSIPLLLPVAPSHQPASPTPRERPPPTPIHHPPPSPRATLAPAPVAHNHASPLPTVPHPTPIPRASCSDLIQ